MDPGVYEHSLLPESSWFLPGGKALSGDTSAPSLQLSLGQQESPYLDTTPSGYRQSNLPWPPQLGPHSVLVGEGIGERFGERGQGPGVLNWGHSIWGGPTSIPGSSGRHCSHTQPERLCALCPSTQCSQSLSCLQAPRTAGQMFMRSRAPRPKPRAPLPGSGSNSLKLSCISPSLLLWCSPFCTHTLTWIP